jgi:hypothetical protein
MRWIAKLIVVLAATWAHGHEALAADALFQGPTYVTYVAGKTYGSYFAYTNAYDGTNTAFYYLSWIDGDKVSAITSVGDLPEGLAFNFVPLPLPPDTSDVALLGTPAAGTEGTYNVTLNATINNTLYTYPITLVIEAASTFTLQPGISGTWYDPALSGQGFNIEVLPNNQLSAFFYTFDPQGNNLFLSGIGDIGAPDNASATIPLNTTSGGFFPPAFDPTKIERAAWGSLVFHFTDCNNGTASWIVNVPGYSNGTIPIKRITSIASLSCN